jgi:hypothetical protein
MVDVPKLRKSDHQKTEEGEKLEHLSSRKKDICKRGINKLTKVKHQMKRCLFSKHAGVQVGIHLEYRFWTGGVAEVVKHLPNKCEALSSDPSTMKKQMFLMWKK